MTHPADAHVGWRVRQRRWMLGVTQRQLAVRIGIRLQQIQKHESGADEISAGQLWRIASALGVPISYFFEGLENQAPDTRGTRAENLADQKTLALVGANRTIAAEVANQAQVIRIVPKAKDRQNQANQPKRRPCVARARLDQNPDSIRLGAQT